MGVTGTIPPELGNLSFLVELHFRNNSFHGTIPQELSHLRRPKIFSFGFNNFKGTIQFPHGSIPREIGNLTKLKLIQLDSNNLREIPNEIGALNQLVEISVENNALEGHLPVAIFNMSSLTALALTWNSLNGTLPDNICQHLPSIQELYLGNNQFVGPLRLFHPNYGNAKSLLYYHWGIIISVEAYPKV
ncbi:putative non-specific serine/threonine protein kinase [Rosa chinensis]|uniref:Putative non-specific serine/threonine protein kinase n=1 Tax=Rosa chinensis TaxID=74649 RepID=A0A2P6QCK1_ROSCH|nr:putative non-specific serine/threonine protein kinase [Rosa chinensis]